MRRRGAAAEGVAQGTDGPGGDRGVAQGDEDAGWRRGTRTRVAQGTEDAGGAGGRGPAKQWRTEGTV